MCAAHAVQTSLLPDSAEIPGFSLRSEYFSADETGGDWYGYQIDTANRRLYFQIGDVTGHGISSALVTGAVYGAISSAHALLPAMKGESDEAALELFVRAANSAVLGSGLKSGRWMTMAFIMIDLESGSALYHNAGHLPLFHKRGHEVKTLLNPGHPLGSVSQVNFQRFQFDPGDVLFMFTDGLVENSPKFRQYELRKILARADHESEVIEAVKMAYLERLKGEKAGDDCTFVTLERRRQHKS
jgi:serine phosphatase RsbU (regulator of sigma subunit)